MRTIRALTIAAAVVAALPTIAAAQGGRQFQNAWFWGVKAGGLTFADSGQRYANAPLAGIEWLITRRNGGLYVSAGQAFFTAKTLVFRDPAAPIDSGRREVKLKNLRRLDLALMAFPGEHLRFHPYAGLGFTLNAVADAVASGPFGNEDQVRFADQVIQDQKVKFAPLLVLGAQWRLPWISVFGQGSVSPTQRDFILYNDRPFNFTYELGIRYNVGSSIDRAP
jgi:hypothetical protein